MASPIRIHRSTREESSTKLDLELLVVFNAVARGRNATRAPDRQNMTQPAISHAARRNDPTFLIIWMRPALRSDRPLTRIRT